MLSTERRAVLEETLRNLPLTRISCLEKVLKHFQTPVGGYNSWYRMRGWILDDLVTCSSQRLKAYLIILTTPGRDFAIPEPLLLSPPNHNLRSGSVTSYSGWPNNWNFSNGFFNDVEVKKVSANEEVDWMSLQRAIQNLPLELNLLIRDTLYEEIFGPGKEIVFPYKGRAYMEHFRALSRPLYDKYSYIYYSENMWVIEDGPAKGLIEASYMATPTILSRIRNITLKWTWWDAENPGPIPPDVQHCIDLEMEMKGAENFDNLDVMWKFKSMCNEITNELHHIWWAKSREIGSMDLDMLVIDAREAFAPDGEFLGLEAARQWEESNHPPNDLEIWAPNNDQDLADQIYNIIRGKYSWQ